jgi:hypothetical protein
MHHYIVLLSDLSYELGLIGLAEYEERRAIADWLSPAGQSLPDPRSHRHDEQEHPHVPDREQENKDAQPLGDSGSSNSPEEDPTDRWPRFLAFNKWMFTLGDRDCYPSVPHGHQHRKTNEWPKLNPYSGRVFSDVHSEDIGGRLKKAEMKKLWNDDDFIEHCRKQVLWYIDFAPEYRFPMARFGKLRFPRW